MDSETHTAVEGRSDRDAFRPECEARPSAFLRRALFQTRRKAHRAPRQARNNKQDGRSSALYAVSLILLAGDVVALLAAHSMVGPNSSAGFLYAFNVLAMSAVMGIFRSRLSFRATDDAMTVIRSTFLALLLPIPILVLSYSPGLTRYMLFATAFLIVARTSGYAIVRHLRCRGYLTVNAVVIGAGAVGREVSRIISEHREFGLRSVGLVDSPRQEDGTEALLGGTDDLPKLLSSRDVKVVIVAFGSRTEAELLHVLRATSGLDIETYVVPRFFELGVESTSRYSQNLWGIPLDRMQGSALRARSWRVKRILDVVISSAVLAITAPLLGIVALAVKATSKGPILFRQTRIGQHGRPFQMLKFRSLSLTEETAVAVSALDGGDDLQVQSARGLEVATRRTAVGTVLRKTGIDELPQFWNVFRGDMSLVGPRPEDIKFVEAFTRSVPGYGERHRLPVGLTGWAQIHGLRGDTSIVERVRFDNQYIENWTLWRDIAILIGTVGALLSDILGSRLTTALPPSDSEPIEPGDQEVPVLVTEAGLPSLPHHAIQQETQSGHLRQAAGVYGMDSGDQPHGAAAVESAASLPATTGSVGGVERGSGAT